MSHWQHDKNLSLLKRIESGEVSTENISFSQSIMASYAFDDKGLIQFDRGDSSEHELLERLDEHQISAIKAYKQSKIN